MRTWRKHADLWIVGGLIACMFAFQHGEATLAALGPRLAAIKNTVSVRLAELSAPNQRAPLDDATEPANIAPATATEANVRSPGSGAVIIPDQERQHPKAMILRTAPQFPVAPHCYEPDFHGCGW